MLPDIKYPKTPQPLSNLAMTTSATATWPSNNGEEVLATHLSQLSVEEFVAQSQRHAMNGTSPTYPSVHAPQRPLFGPYDGTNQYLFYPPGTDAFQTPSSGSSAYPYAGEQGSPMSSLHSLQSLHSLPSIQSLQAMANVGLGFETYPTPSDNFSHGDARPQGSRVGLGISNFQQQSANSRNGGFNGFQQPLTAQSTGQGYFAYGDGAGYVPFTPRSQAPSRLGAGRHSRLNSNGASPRRGGHSNRIALEYSRQLQSLVYPGSTNGQFSLPGFPSNPYASPAFAFQALPSFAGTPMARSARLDDFRRHRNNRLELSDIFGHICEFAGDQHGSRLIQNKLETASPEDRAKVFDEIMPNAYQLMTDVFGNYVIQKLFEHGDQAQKAALASKMETHVLQLSMQMYGCRVVQKALEHVLFEQREKLVAEIAGHVIECVKSANANHVIQRLIALDPPASVLDAFKGHVYELSVHPFGCRVLQKTFEAIPPAKIRPLLNEMHMSSARLMTDQFGNYVVQSVITDADDRAYDRDKVIAVIKTRIYDLCRHKFASNVVEKAIKYANREDRRQLISELMGENTNNTEDRIATLLRDGYGNFPVQTALAHAEPDQRDKLLAIIVPLMTSIRHTPCGRRLEAKINEYETKGLVPSLTPSLSASSINSPDLVNNGSDSDETMGDPFLTPPSKNINTLRRVASPDSQDEQEVAKTLFA